MGIHQDLGPLGRREEESRMAEPLDGYASGLRGHAHKPRRRRSCQLDFMTEGVRPAWKPKGKDRENDENQHGFM